MLTLRPRALVVQRWRNGQAAQVDLGKCTVLPTCNGTLTYIRAGNCLRLPIHNKSTFGKTPTPIPYRPRDWDEVSATLVFWGGNPPFQISGCCAVLLFNWCNPRSVMPRSLRPSSISMPSPATAAACICLDKSDFLARQLAPQPLKNLWPSCEFKEKSVWLGNISSDRNKSLIFLFLL
jgi:hypothetical protein